MTDGSQQEARGFTRGGLIKTGAVAALAAGAGGAGTVLAGTVGANAAGLNPAGIGKPGGGAVYLRRSTYAPLVGTDFRVHVPGERPLSMKLVEARKLRGPGDSFSLLFRGRHTADVPGGLYRLEHPALGAFELFVNPVGRGVKGLNLEAVINRIAT